MSGIVNPFAQVGDYRANLAQSEDELVTSGYLTGLPDPRQISNSRVALIFKQLLKRDSRTKLRALSDFVQWIDSLGTEEYIEEPIHLSYVQLYAKLSIEVSVQVRAHSHKALESLYSRLGKRSSKYLKYSVGPWLAGQFDPDVEVSRAAREALVKVFPGDKVKLLVAKLLEPLRTFIYTCCSRETAFTLTDERYYSKDECTQKYTRLIKCCLDILIEYPSLFDLENPEINDLVSSGRIWKFFSSSDSGLARSALRLVQTQLPVLSDNVDVIWKELLRAGRKNSGGPGVALEIVHLMTVLTKKYPDDTWPKDTSLRKDYLASLGQFITTEPAHLAKYWPLLYNLALIIPEPPSRDLTPLYKPLEKVALRTRNNRELEDSIWGCYVSLSARMGWEYVERAIRAAETRCQQPNPPIESMAKFFERVPESDKVEHAVDSLLRKDPPLAFNLMISMIPRFKSHIESIVLPKLNVRDLSLLISTNNDLTVPSDVEVTPDSEWIALAINSRHMNTQSILDKLVQFGMQRELLKNAPLLASKGVKLDLDSYILQHLDDPEVLEFASGASSSFCSFDVALEAFEALVDLSLSERGFEDSISRVIRSNMDFVAEAVKADTGIIDKLEVLSLEGKLGAARLDNVLSSSRDDDLSTHEGLGLDYLQTLDLEELKLTVPHEAVIYPVRSSLAPFSQSRAEGLSTCESLVQKLETSLSSVVAESVEISESTDLCTKLLLIDQYVRSWDMIAPKDAFKSFHELISRLSIQPDWSSLWNLLDSSSSLVSYLAAATFIRLGPMPASGEFTKFDRALFARPSYKAAILSSFSTITGNAAYDSLQRNLAKESLDGKLKLSEWMILDRSHIPNSSRYEIEMDDNESSMLLYSVFAVQSYRSKVSNLELAISKSSDRALQYVALESLEDVKRWDQLLAYAIKLPQISGLDFLLSGRVLKIVNDNLNNLNLPAEDYAESMQKLLSRDDSLTLCWIALRLAIAAETAASLQLSLVGDLQTSPTVLISWIIAFNDMGENSRPDSDLRHVFGFIASEMKSTQLLTQSSKEFIDIKALKEPPENRSLLALNFLYHLCSSQPNSVREWYRDIRDKAFLKQLDQALATRILPAVLDSIADEVKTMSFSDEVDVTVNKKQREVKATRVVEEEFQVEILITLPEQYPGRPAVINIRNLAGVSEAKKRGWLLEARQKLQDGGILKALSAVLTRLENFLDGVEPCAICYMTVNNLNKLPNKSCSQCHNIYHSDCLYKWFSTNGNKLCPMCRTPM